MKPCGTCGQANPDEAHFCHQCGSPFSEQARPSAEQTTASDQSAGVLFTEPQLWRAFIGPNADRYLDQFKRFTTDAAPRFALTWHWPAFLFDPFLWFLYRKMYLYALVYAVGPVLSAYLTGDLTVGIVWRVMAGVSANYIYYWHIREQVGRIRAARGLDAGGQERLLQDAGGVQPYVIWLGVALHLILLAAVIMAGQQGLLEKATGP
jgi:hypothetical protein